MTTFLARLLVILSLVFAVPAAATVTTSANKTIIAGNNVQTSFTFGFVGVAASDISVIFTNASGVSTTLTQGPGSTQYQVTLTAPAPGQLWGIGGTVVYDPGGTPIATGTTLTIVRTVPMTQSTSLQNQASFGQYAAATEKALDQLDMQVQQIAEGAGPCHLRSDRRSVEHQSDAAAGRAAGQYRACVRWVGQRDRRRRPGDGHDLVGDDAGRQRGNAICRPDSLRPRHDGAGEYQQRHLRRRDDPG
jgi:hypothetical protein